MRADATLRDLIRFAFNLQDFQIEGGPAGSRRADSRSTPRRIGASARRHARARASSAAGSIRAESTRESREMAALRAVVVARRWQAWREAAALDIGLRGDLASGTATTDDLARCDLRFRPKMSRAAADRPSIHSMTLMLQGVRWRGWRRCCRTKSAHRHRQDRPRRYVRPRARIRAAGHAARWPAAGPPAAAVRWSAAGDRIPGAARTEARIRARTGAGARHRSARVANSRLRSLQFPS